MVPIYECISASSSIHLMVFFAQRDWLVDGALVLNGLLHSDVELIDPFPSVAFHTYTPEQAQWWCSRNEKKRVTVCNHLAFNNMVIK